ncbi:hypothetical protein K456DRAFT_48738 [Colletotrichum gloeosporioides 23]|nr:hypothetical protein K456DRAFT_48738 [Colletotrichum gloeosporioides 23]
MIAEPKLYKLGAFRHPYLLCWATDVGYLNAMKKALSVPFDPQNGLIRYTPSDIYQEWDRDTVSPKERFHRHYRTLGEPFQRRSDWLDSGDFRDRSLSDFEDEDDDLEGIVADSTRSDISAIEVRNARIWDAQAFGVVNWPDNDFDIYDILEEPKAVYWFPVHIAARHGNMEALKLLVESGAFLNVPSKGLCVHLNDPNNQQVLHFPDWTEFLDPYVIYPAWTPYHIALCRGHNDMALYILEKCPHISERLLFDGDELFDEIPRFITAMRHANSDVAELSPERDLDNIGIPYPDVFNGTLLWRAFWELENFEPALEMLLEYGADLEEDLGEVHTLLVEACYHGHFREALALVDAGADVSVVFQEAGPRTNMEEAILTRGAEALCGAGVLEIACRAPPSWLRKSPVSDPSSDVALAVVARLLSFGVDDDVKNAALLVACRFHRVEILELLLESGGNIQSTDVDGLSTLMNVATVDSNWEMRDWSVGLLDTLAVLLNHADKTGQQLEGGVPAGEALLALCGSDRCNALDHGRITEAILALVREGLLDVNHRVHDQSLIMEAVRMRSFHFAHALYDLAARDDLAELWSIAFVRPTYYGASTNYRASTDIIYKFLAMIDSDQRLFKESYFVATAMVSDARSVVNLMEPYLQLDKDWVNERSGLFPFPIQRLVSTRLEFNGWSLLHFAVYYGYLGICSRLVTMGAAIHVAAKGGETPLSLVLGQPRIFDLLMAGEPQLSAETAVQYRFLAEDSIDVGHWRHVERILAICPRRGLSATRGPRLLHALIRYCFSETNRTSCTIHKDVLRSGADVNEIDEDGNTTLGYLLVRTISAVETGIYDFVLDNFVTVILPSLILSGAKPSIRNRKGQSVLELLDHVRGWKADDFEVSELLKTTLLYQVMLYRQSIGM